MKKIRTALSPGGAKHEYLLDMLRHEGFDAYIEDEETVSDIDYYIAPKIKENTALLSRGITPFEYFAREDFKRANGILTAEAAIPYAVNAFDGSIAGASILICGFGCIAKPLMAYLRALGAAVTVAARKPADRLCAELSGALSDTLPITRGGYDLVFNTVPAPVLDDAALSLMPDAPVIDLASAPGGVTGACKKLIPALALPGKYMPRAAAKVILASFKSYLKEADI